LIATAILAGCVERLVGEDTDFSTGEVLTPEMIESIFNEISVPVTEKYPTETDSNGEVLLYWLEGGSVWHTSLKCGSVARASAENLHTGSLSDALSAGKERGCKLCAKNYEPSLESEGPSVTDVEQTKDKYPRDYDAEGNLIVYWLKGGSVWHESRECSSLSKSSDSNILSGTVNDAQTSGKERACKICSENN
jgi:hypothetical protein